MKIGFAVMSSVAVLITAADIGIQIALGHPAMILVGLLILAVNVAALWLNVTTAARSRKS